MICSRLNQRILNPIELLAELMNNELDIPIDVSTDISTNVSTSASTSDCNQSFFKAKLKEQSKLKWLKQPMIF
jgi:hypothetical protein